jgi:hypothetical protein
MINLVTSFYISKLSSHKDILRSRELQATLLNNIKSSVIEKIHLFVDNEDSHNTLLNIIKNTNTDKITVIEIGKKPTYSDYFKYIIENLQNKICMIANSDIYIHKVDNSVLDMLEKNNWGYALTRHEFDLSCPLINNYAGSHDCYIFKANLVNESILENVRFYQNYLGIETRIIKALCEQNIKIFNPCRQIKIVHLHKSELRKHGEWIGLHNLGDDDCLKLSCWYVPPINIEI